MFPKIDPRQMNTMMKQLGIKNEEVKADRVVIESSDGSIIIENPTVTKISMQGNVSYQISGNEKKVEKELFSEEDVKLVAEKTGKTEEEAEEALKAAEGDIAEAIIALQS